MAALRATLVILLLARAAAAQTIEFKDGAFRVSGWKPGRPVNAEDLSSIFTVHRVARICFFDPGRIKRGLDANVELGPPIGEGEEYTLVIDREFLDARGVPLEQGLKKLFRGTPADRTPIDPKQWILKPPRAGTSDALIVDFPKPMDYALLERLLTIPGVPGTVSIDRAETRWTFIPNQPWRPGKYELKVDLALEDLAGNRIDRVFDWIQPKAPLSRQSPAQQSRYHFWFRNIPLPPGEGGAPRRAG
jgi:hypothetical protein